MFNDAGKQPVCQLNAEGHNATFHSMLHAMLTVCESTPGIFACTVMPNISTVK